MRNRILFNIGLHLWNGEVEREIHMIIQIFKLLAQRTLMMFWVAWYPRTSTRLRPKGQSKREIYTV